MSTIATSHAPRRIFLMVPYPARDLEGLALVGHRLERLYGHEVLYSNGYGIERKLLKLQPDVVGIDHFVWRFKVDQQRMAHRLGMKTLMLPTEGLFQGNEGVLEVTGANHDALGELDHYLCWGDFPRRALRSTGKMLEDRIEVAGCPRFDFYHESLRPLAEPRAEFLARFAVPNPDRPLIVWTTNTTYLSRDPEETVRRYVKKGNYTREQVMEFVLDERQQFQHHSSIILELAKRRPDWNILIKVHPAEWISPYEDFIKQSPNLHLAYNWPIRDFLIHCDALIQRNCTTATEAWMLNKPVIQIESDGYRRVARPEYQNGNHVTETADQTLDAIDAYLRGAAIPDDQAKARREFIADFYHQVDGRSHERWADAIHRLATAPSYSDDDQNRRRELSARAYEEWKANEDRRLPNRLKDLLGVDRDHPLRFWKGLRLGKARGTLGKFTPEKETTREEVEALYRKFDALKPS